MEIGLAPRGTRKGDVVWKFPRDQSAFSSYAIIRSCATCLGRVHGRARVGGKRLSWFKVQDFSPVAEALALRDEQTSKYGRAISLAVELPVLQVLTCPMRSLSETWRFPSQLTETRSLSATKSYISKSMFLMD